MNAQVAPFSTIADYLAFEKDAEIRHEYERGDILAMSGGTIAHAKLCAEIQFQLNRATRNSKCQTFGGEARLRIEKANCFVYPDAMVICGKIQASKDDEDSVTNPVLIVEVISKSTEGYDRGGKFFKYRQLDSFKEYVLISQKEPTVEVFYKVKDIWEFKSITGLDKKVKLRSINVEVTLAELYRNIEF